MRFKQSVFILGVVVCTCSLILTGCATPYDQLRSAIDTDNLEDAQHSLTKGANPSEQLSYAVYKMKHKVARLLLSQGANPNYSDQTVTLVDELFLVNSKTNEQFKYNPKRGATELDLTSVVDTNTQNQIKQKVVSLLESRQFYWRYKLKEYYVPNNLWWAIRNDDTEMVRLLLEFGVNKNIEVSHENADLRVPSQNLGLPFISSEGILATALRGQPFSVVVNGVREYIQPDKGYIISNNMPLQGEIITKSALEYAQSEGKTYIVKLLENQPIDATKKLAAIFDSLTANDLSQIRDLIDAGADVNITADNGATPLFRASYNGYTEIVKLLLAAGAEVNAVRKDNGATPLLFATQQGHAEVVKLLLEANAGVNDASKDGRTPLLIASQKGHEEVVKLLLAAKADVNVMDKDTGRTPLFMASQDGHTGVVKLLLDKGADVNAKAVLNGVDWTAIKVDKKKGPTVIVRILETYSAKE
ncbi:MAG: ankyrin repeat domain-containing protein [Nitrospirae bacterium]|nr:ankyrin repeat domain-containing protein [Nitrospirota bacterium]